MDDAMNARTMSALVRPSWHIWRAERPPGIGRKLRQVTLDIRVAARQDR
jgi:hypothetical protein